MKTTTLKAFWPLFSLCLVVLVYACRNKEAEPLSPFTFDALKNLHLPNAKVSAPAAVTVTPSVLTESSTWTNVKNGIAGIPGSGSVPGVVTYAISDMNGGLSSAGVSAGNFAASFTPQIVANLTGLGTLPSPLQNTVNMLVGNVPLQAYFPTFTYPQINGQEIGPTSMSLTGGPGLFGAITVAVRVNPINYSGGDACFKNANDTFDAKILGLDGERLNQIAPIDASYAQAKTDAESAGPTCVSDNVTKYGNLITSAKQELDATLANLSSGRAILGEANYSTLVALTYLQFARRVQIYSNLRAADVNTCSITQVTKIAAAKFSRDTDVDAINKAFNQTILTAQTIVLGLYDSCHNQGSSNP